LPLHEARHILPVLTHQGGQVFFGTLLNTSFILPAFSSVSHAIFAPFPP